MSTKTFWLRPSADCTALDSLATDERWSLHEDEERAHTFPKTRSWIVGETDGGPQQTVGIRENHVLGVRVAWAPEGELAARVGSLLPHYSRDELLASATAGTNLVDVLHALRVLTLMERAAPSAELLALFSRWITYEADGEPKAQYVRRALLHLCWIGRWPALLPLIEARGRQDQDPTLAEDFRLLAVDLQGGSASAEST